MASARRGCSARGNAASVCAVVAESRPASTCAATAGASRRPSVRRRSTQPRPRSSSLAICVGVSWSSSASERTTRASSIGLSVRRGALASSSRALPTTPGASSTTTGTWVWPSRLQRAKRLNPSSTSQVPASVAATRNGNGASPLAASVRGPRSGASVVARCAIGRSSTVLTGGRRRGAGAGRAGSGRRPAPWRQAGSGPG